MKNARAKHIATAAQAIDTLGGNAAVGKWLTLDIGMPAEPSTISGWRKRGISRNFAIHFFAELSIKRGYTLAPAVFGLESWDHVLMPDARGRRLRRVA